MEKLSKQPKLYLIASSCKCNVNKQYSEQDFQQKGPWKAIDYRYRRICRFINHLQKTVFFFSWAGRYIYK